MTIKTIKADKDSTLDYPVDWSAWLEPGEQIATSEWLSDSENVVFGQSGVSDKLDDEGAVIAPRSIAYSFTSFTDAAQEGDEYLITNRMTDSHNPPRTQDQSIRLVLVEK